MVCSNCGNHNSEHAFICGKCSRRLDAVSRRQFSGEGENMQDTANISPKTNSAPIEVNIDSGSVVTSTVIPNQRVYAPSNVSQGEIISNAQNPTLKKRNNVLILVLIVLVFVFLASIPTTILIYVNLIRGNSILSGPNSTVSTTPVEGWVQYTDNSGGFDVSFPLNPSKTSTPLSNNSSVTLYTSINNSNSNQYTLLWINFPVTIDTTKVKPILDAELNKLKAQSDVVIISSSYSTFKTYTALSYEMKQKDVDGKFTYIKGITFIARGKLFQMTVDSKDIASYKNYDDYVNSFSLK